VCYIVVDFEIVTPINENCENRFYNVFDNLIACCVRLYSFNAFNRKIKGFVKTAKIEKIESFEVLFISIEKWSKLIETFRKMVFTLLNILWTFRVIWSAWENSTRSNCTTRKIIEISKNALKRIIVKTIHPSLRSESRTWFITTNYYER